MQKFFNNYGWLINTTSIIIALTAVFISFGTVSEQQEQLDRMEAKVQESEAQLQATESEYIQLAVESEMLKRELEAVEAYYSNPASYDGNDIRKPSYMEPHEYDAILAGTGLEGIGWALAKAEREYSINGLFLLSLSAQESGWGTNRLTTEKNNITSFTAYDSNPMKHATEFESKAQCILATAKWLDEHYLTDGGKYFKGYSTYALNEHYASDDEWARKIDTIAKGVLNKHQRNEK